MKDSAPRFSCDLPTLTLLKIVLFAGIFVFNFFQGTDVDFWWHLATGRYIADTATIPHADPFSYTAAGQPWVAHEWLAELCIYLVFHSGGYVALVVLFALLITLAYWFTFRTLEMLRLSTVAASCITFWIAAMSMAGWHVRPQAFSYLLFSLYLYLIVRSRDHADRWLWLLPAIMLAWVNLHAGYIMGLLLLGLFIVGEAINNLQKMRGHTGLDAEAAVRAEAEKAFSSPPSAEKRERHLAFGARLLAPPFSHLLATAAATLAATTFNPQGAAMLLYPFIYAGTQNASMKYITEWQSPNFHEYFFFLFGASMMALMVAPGKRPIDWALGIPLLALTAMSLQSVRVIPFYAIVAGPFLGQRLATPVGSRLRDAEAGSKQQAKGGGNETQGASIRRLASKSKRSTPWNWPLLIICLAIMFSTLFLTDRAQIGSEPKMNDFPTRGAQYIKENGLNGNIFNTYHWGGYLIWYFYPERRVFIDGRPDMYGDTFVEEFRKVHDARPGWQQVLDRYQVEVALVEKDSRVAALLAASKEWKEVFTGDNEVVLVRSSP